MLTVTTNKTNNWTNRVYVWKPSLIHCCPKSCQRYTKIIVKVNWLKWIRNAPLQSYIPKMFRRRVRVPITGDNVSHTLPSGTRLLLLSALFAAKGFVLKSWKRLLKGLGTEHTTNIWRNLTNCSRRTISQRNLQSHQLAIAGHCNLRPPEWPDIEPVSLCLNYQTHNAPAYQISTWSGNAHLSYNVLLLIPRVRLWPWPLTLWPRTFVVCRLSCDQSMYQILSKWNNSQWVTPI